MIVELIEKYNDLIKAMKQKVADWSKLQSAKNFEIGFKGHIVKSSTANSEHGAEIWIQSPICFVEGFLLYTMADAVNKENGSPEEITKKIQEKEVLQDKMSQGTLSDEDLDTLEAYHLEEGTEAMHELMQLLDVKLFLPTSKATAGRRRFNRCEYLDHPHGERAPGQMWKAQGYFENVVWKNYLKDHQVCSTLD
jgi:hypothetical protein